MSRTPRAPRASPVLAPGPVPQTTSLPHRCCRDDIDVTSLLFARGKPGRPGGAGARVAGRMRLAGRTGEAKPGLGPRLVRNSSYSSGIAETGSAGLRFVPESQVQRAGGWSCQDSGPSGNDVNHLSRACVFVDVYGCRKAEPRAMWCLSATISAETGKIMGRHARPHGARPFRDVADGRVRLPAPWPGSSAATFLAVLHFRMTRLLGMPGLRISDQWAEWALRVFAADQKRMAAIGSSRLSP